VRNDSTSDEELAARAARGDAGALDALLRRHTSLVHAVCRRVLGNADDALDASQEALIAIARKIHLFDGRSRFSTWAYRVATNAALDEGRRRNRRPQPFETPPERLNHASRAVDDHVADQIDIDAALDQLSPDYRAAVALRDLVGMDYAEIGEVLGVPPGTVRSRISRGRAMVAEILGNREQSFEHPTRGTT
jgi:RNA polymerase sigma-70 factor (ECF subfamily)